MSKSIEAASAGYVPQRGSTIIGNRYIHTRPGSLHIGSIPPGQEELLAQADLATVGFDAKPALAAYLSTWGATWLITQRPLTTAFGAALTIPLCGYKPYKNYRLAERWRRLRDEVLHNSLRLPIQDMAIDLPTASYASAPAVPHAGNALEAPIKTLIASTAGMPGISLWQRKDRKRTITGVLNPGLATSFMIDTLQTPEQQDTFLTRASGALAVASSAAPNTPTMPRKDVAPELLPTYDAAQYITLSSMLGVAAAFLTTARSGLSEQVNLRATSHTLTTPHIDQSGPQGLAAKLIDPTIPITWQQIQTYQKSLGA